MHGWQLRQLRTLIAMAKHLVLATRGSQLALWQANHVKESLMEANPGLAVSLNVIKTRGDSILNVPLAQVGGKGLFVKEIEDALLDGRADLAVHSVKDVPMELPEGLILGCMPQREDSSDCFLSWKYPTLEALPPGATVGTSSLRRRAQLLALRPDLQIVGLRGNVDTRLKKLENGNLDAIILATAALFRLGMHAPHMATLPESQFLPAPGQGALGIECGEDNYDLLVKLCALENRNTRVCVEAERSLMRRLDGSCQTPIAAHAAMPGEETVELSALVATPDGKTIIRKSMHGDASQAEELGVALAESLLAAGADKILAQLRDRA